MMGSRDTFAMLNHEKEVLLPLISTPGKPILVVIRMDEHDYDWENVWFNYCGSWLNINSPEYAHVDGWFFDDDARDGNEIRVEFPKLRIRRVLVYFLTDDDWSACFNSFNHSENEIVCLWDLRKGDQDEKST